MYLNTIFNITQVIAVKLLPKNCLTKIDIGNKILKKIPHIKYVK